MMRQRLGVGCLLPSRVVLVVSWHEGNTSAKTLQRYWLDAAGQWELKRHSHYCLGLQCLCCPSVADLAPGVTWRGCRGCGTTATAGRSVQQPLGALMHEKEMCFGGCFQWMMETYLAIPRSGAWSCLARTKSTTGTLSLGCKVKVATAGGMVCGPCCGMHVD
jgi:hypothetical protein